MKNKKILGSKRPLYHIPLEKFNLLRNTLRKHLSRGFIILNKVIYTLPILFTFKLNGG